MIKASDISVVVQGPIAGRPSDPYDQRLTYRCLESIRRHLPGAEVVLSTWQGSDVSGLPYDVLVESEDPGAFSCTVEEFSRPVSAGSTRMETFALPKIYYNANRQILSTRAGIEAASRELAVKIRGDMVFMGDGFTRFFRQYNERNDAWRILRDRVVTTTFYARNPHRRFAYPFHPSDWFYFGWREDLLNIWDIPFAPEPETSRWYETRPRPENDWEAQFLYRYTVEQYIWLSFLRKHGEVRFEHKTDHGNDSIDVSELTIANNLVLADLSQLQLEFLKFPLRKSDWASTYTHGEWLRLYRKWCDPAVACPPDVVLWRKKASVANYKMFSALEEIRRSDWAHGLSNRWRERSPASFRAAKTVVSPVLRGLALLDDFRRTV